MTRFLKDILRQPAELHRTIEHLCGPGQPGLREAATTAQKARHIFLTGIGSSWNAALSVAPLFYSAGCPVHLLDTGELLQLSAFPPDSVLIAISRSGRSIEICNMLTKARECNATVIGLTLMADGQLAHDAQISIIVPVERDHAVSVNSYTSLAAAAGILAGSIVGSFNPSLAASLLHSVTEAARRVPDWQEQIAESAWLASDNPTYFLGRGGSLGSCHEARLLWEECAKSPATAMGTGSFRHGPQEIVTSEVRFGVWIDAQRMRDQDLSVAFELRRLGASLAVIGQDLSLDTGDVVFLIPRIAPDWQFMIDIIPAQLMAESLARRRGVDCDSFRICSYIVEDEYGLGEAAALKERHSLR